MNNFQIQMSKSGILLTFKRFPVTSYCIFLIYPKLLIIVTSNKTLKNLSRDKQIYVFFYVLILLSLVHIFFRFIWSTKDQVSCTRLIGEWSHVFSKKLSTLIYISKLYLKSVLFWQSMYLRKSTGFSLLGLSLFQIYFG